LSKIEEDIVYDILKKIIPSTKYNITKGNNSDGSYYIRITNIDSMMDYYIDFPIKLPLEISGTIFYLENPENNGGLLPPPFFLQYPIIDEIYFTVI